MVIKTIRSSVILLRYFDVWFIIAFIVNEVTDNSSTVKNRINEAAEESKIISEH